MGGRNLVRGSILDYLRGSEANLGLFEGSEPRSRLYFGLFEGLGGHFGPVWGAWLEDLFDGPGLRIYFGLF